jgi:hypothetical protein
MLDSGRMISQSGHRGFPGFAFFGLACHRRRWGPDLTAAPRVRLALTRGVIRIFCIWLSAGMVWIVTGSQRALPNNQPFPSPPESTSKAGRFRTEFMKNSAPSPTMQRLAVAKAFIREQWLPYLRHRDRKPLRVQFQEIRRLAVIEDNPVATYMQRRLYLRSNPLSDHHLPVRFMESFILETNSRFAPDGRPGRWDGGRIGFAFDKFAFWLVMNGAGLPVVPVILASLGDGSWVRGDQSPVSGEDAARDLEIGLGRLFAKKTTGFAGQGAFVLQSVAQVAKLLRRPNMLVQPVVVQHPAMAALHPPSLNTLRVITHTQSGGTEFVAAALRAGRGGAQIDNTSQGGISAPLNPDSGTVFKGAHTYAKHEPDQPVYETHPDTGSRINGMKIPYWEDAVELIVKACGVVGGCTTLGWDVAITPDGPVLLEVNDRWDPNFMVLHFDLKSTGFGKAAWDAMIRES